MIESRAVAGHVDHYGAVGHVRDLAVDRRDERPLGLASRRAERPELVNGHDARRARRLRAARAVGLDEIVEGPARLTELQPRDADAHRIASAARIALGRICRRRRAPRRVEHTHLGPAALGQHVPGEVEPLVLHDERRREHRAHHVLAARSRESAERDSSHDCPVAHACPRSDERYP